MSHFEREWPLISAWILQHTGIHIRDDNKNSIALAIQTLCKNTGCEEWAFFGHLSTGAIPAEDFIDLITTNESFFLRYRSVMSDVINHTIQPLLKKGVKPRILCAPCANGEEPYSFAILLHNAGITIDQVEIVGVDISQSCIEHAKDGVFSQYAFRRTPSHIVSRYFSGTNKTGFQINPQFTRHIVFQPLNLVTQSALLTPGFHIIFFNNLLIYFDNVQSHRVMRNLKDLLAIDGWIFCDSSEAPKLREMYDSDSLGSSTGFRKNTRKPQAKSQGTKTTIPAQISPSVPPTINTVNVRRLEPNTPPAPLPVSRTDPTPLARLNDARNSYFNKKTQYAKQQFESVLIQHPEYRAKAEVGLSLIYADQGDSLQSLDLAESALSLHEGGIGNTLSVSEQCDAHGVIAVTLMSKGLHALAEEHFRSIESAEPSHPTLSLRPR